MAGGGVRQCERRRGLRYNSKSRLKEAFTSRMLSVILQPRCRDDNRAPGAKPGTQPVTYTMCGHVSRITEVFFSIRRTCPQCHGREYQDPCSSAPGRDCITEGARYGSTTGEIIEDGTRIRLAGEGEAELRGNPAISTSSCRVKPHEVLPARRHRRFVQRCRSAALAAPSKSRQLDGSQTRVKVPEGTRTAASSVSRGRGACRYCARRPRLAISTFRLPVGHRRESLLQRGAGRIPSGTIWEKFAAIRRLLRA